MQVLMVAPPGGKGTQGALIAAHFNIPRIATGELLRDHVARQTAAGPAVQAYLDRGELAPDQIVLDMVREAMIAAKASGGGYVLDGIPRNMEQARDPGRAEALRPSLDRAPSPERLPPDLTGLGEACGVTGSVGGKSE